MAIFKAVTGPDGKAIGRAKPEKLEQYLKYEQDESGKIQRDHLGHKKARDAIVTALCTGGSGGVFDAVSPEHNHEVALRERFSERCRAIAAIHSQNKAYDDVKYKHYVQAFAEEDSRLMSREKCHELGVEAARTFWPGFPVLVVTHFDQSGEDGYHWHNHFMVYNCHAETGKKIRTSRAEMVAQKRFIAMQAKAHGLTERGLMMDRHGNIRSSEEPVKKIGEKYMSEKMNDTLGPKDERPRTQRAVLKLCIISSAMWSSSFEEFVARLNLAGIQVKESRGSISYLHPDRVGVYGNGFVDGWIRGKTMGDDYTREVIEDVIREQNNRRNGRAGGANRSWKESVYGIYFNTGPEPVIPRDKGEPSDERDLELLNRLVGEDNRLRQEFQEGGRGL